MQASLRIVLIVFYGLAIPSTSLAQVLDWTKKQVSSVLNDTSATEQPKFIAYPTIAYAPETRWEFGVSALYVYYAQKDTTNRLSEINAFTFFTLEQQYGLWLDHALYSDQSEWFFLGRLRYQRFPLLYYGIGPDTPEEELAQVDANSIAVRERVLRNITGSLYMGIELDFQRLGNVDFIPVQNEPFPLPTGNEGSTNMGIGIGLVYDDRHNVLNVRKGFFGETGFLHYDERWGSDFSFTQYFLDARYYYPVNRNQVLAHQLYGVSMNGEVPFNQLALMGGESLMRGYYTGRYRDKTLLATQLEYRFLPFPFSRRWGAAAFLSAGGVAPEPREIKLGDWVVAGGAGVRFLLFPTKDIYTRLDVAFTEEGVGYYFFIGEAF
ncbi:outer membrane protein assembly factor BamA [Catalinimonas alkaloidigena]|uniref:BamA/TamA family outer membrane protein n=1 Tax=Catalinimonas alkaloidigena TaxID=1075417 RepID=UPI0024059519|nr:BamA/TamA family outer membrane protein [Catalinimonas alkaloidigena]MDF9799049.1 outer membrane protein assembly factor BamA [Catalinimonas alkaloidigena]